MTFLREAISAGAGIGFMPAPICATLLCSSRVAFHDAGQCPRGVPAQIVYPSHATFPNGRPPPATPSSINPARVLLSYLPEEKK